MMLLSQNISTKAYNPLSLLYVMVAAVFCFDPKNCQSSEEEGISK